MNTDYSIKRILFRKLVTYARNKYYINYIELLNIGVSTLKKASRHNLIKSPRDEDYCINLTAKLLILFYEGQILPLSDNLRHTFH